MQNDEQAARNEKNIRGIYNILKILLVIYGISAIWEFINWLHAHGVFDRVNYG